MPSISDEENLDDMPDRLLRMANAATDYTLTQVNGQRIYRRKPETWLSRDEPSRECEIFIGRLPRDCYEDELIPLFGQAGTIFEFRLLVQFSGYNRGYAFAMFSSPSEALTAVEMFDNYKIRPQWNLGVCPSLNNCLLYLHKVPILISNEEIVRFLMSVSDEVVGIEQRFLSNHMGILVEFKSHRGAAMARKVLIPAVASHWGPSVTADWSVPIWDLDRKLFRPLENLPAIIARIRSEEEPTISTIRQELPPDVRRRRMRMITEAHALSKQRRAEFPRRSISHLGCQIDNYVGTSRDKDGPIITQPSSINPYNAANVNRSFKPNTALINSHDALIPMSHSRGRMITPQVINSPPVNANYSTPKNDDIDALSNMLSYQLRVAREQPNHQRFVSSTANLSQSFEGTNNGEQVVPAAYREGYTPQRQYNPWSYDPLVSIIPKKEFDKNGKK